MQKLHSVINHITLHYIRCKFVTTDVKKRIEQCFNVLDSITIFIMSCTQGYVYKYKG